MIVIFRCIKCTYNHKGRYLRNLLFLVFLFWALCPRRTQTKNNIALIGLSDKILLLLINMYIISESPMWLASSRSMPQNWSNTSCCCVSSHDWWNYWQTHGGESYRQETSRKDCHQEGTFPWWSQLRWFGSWRIRNFTSRAVRSSQLQRLRQINFFQWLR